MANILVYIELHGDRPCAASLQALGEGRRIASFLGATLYAVLPCATPPKYKDDDAITVLSQHGADKVVMSPGPELGTPATYITHGPSLVAAMERVPPTLVLLAATPGGRDLAPRIAARLGAAYIPETSVEYGPRGDLVLARVIYGGGYRRRLAADDVERPIVATFTPGSYEVAAGDEEAEVIVVKGADKPPPMLEELASRPDPGTDLDGARVIVCAGAGVSPEAYGVLKQLAAALGGEIAVTHGAVEQGLDSADREIGVGGRRVAPRLYLACGASGSAAHLVGVSSDAQIVAINRDPQAPIFRVATYGIVADVGETAARLLAALRDRPRTAAAAGEQVTP